MSTKLAFFSELSPQAKGALIGATLLGGTRAVSKYLDPASNYIVPEGVDFNSLTPGQIKRLKKNKSKASDVLGAGLGGAIGGAGLGYVAGRLLNGISAAAADYNRPPTKEEISRGHDPDPRSEQTVDRATAQKLGLPYGTKIKELVPMGSSSNIPRARMNGVDLNMPKSTDNLREHLQPIYEVAPGGLDKAVSEAQKWQNEAKAKGLVSWTPEALDKTVRWTDNPAEWARVGQLGGIGAGRTMGLNIGPFDWIYMDPTSKGKDRSNVFLHELTHAALKPSGVKNLIEQARLKDNVTSNPFSMGANKGKFWEYFTRPEEFKAHLAEAKREWVQKNRQQLDTKEKALDALKQYGKTGPATSVLKGLIPDLLANPDAKEKALIQLLSIVSGKSRNNSTFA